MKDTDQPILHKDGVSYVLPFILVTCCFALWGFANDITNPMVKAFSKIFRMSVTDGALVQVAFYGGYFAMAFPAAMFIRKYSYKAGILLGLGLYAVGALLFFPAKMTGSYYPFLLAYFILTCGLSFLETSSNPYILSMGTEATATRRLNLAQSFNPMGSLLGMYVAMNFIQAKLNPMDTAERAQLNPAEFAMVRDADLSVLIAPYLTIGIVILVMLLVIRFTQMPKNGDQSHSINFGPTLKRIFSIHHYREGVVAQFFYVVRRLCVGPSLSNTAHACSCHKVWRRKLPKYYHKNIISLRWLFSVSAVLSVPSSCATSIQVNYWPYLPLRVAASPPESSSSRISGVCTAW